MKTLEEKWKNDPRWQGIKRPYSAEQVRKLQGSLQIEYTLAKLTTAKLWKLFENESFIRTMGAMSGNQAVQLVQAGLKAIYISGWQVAADANDALQTYPDQSLYPVQSVPHLIKRIQNALIRADQIQHLNKSGNIDWFVPLIVDAEAGFGGPLNAFELTKAMIEAGAAAIHFEDQLSSQKKCGHMGGKVLVPTHEFIEKLVSARLAADVMGVETILIGRTDAESAKYLLADSNDIDKKYLTGNKTCEGYFECRAGIEYAIERALQFAPYCDLVWCETSKPDLKEAKAFADGIHAKYPGKWLAYNCSPSFNWVKNMPMEEMAIFQEKLGEMGYKFQFITLAGFHALNASIFKLAKNYAENGMKAFGEFQQEEFELEKLGFKALKHQSFVGAGYFDEVFSTINSQVSTKAMDGSTEEAQF